jgi:hypothetical protein
MSPLVKPLTWILGLVLTLVGVAGFFTGSPLIIFEVNNVHNVVHILSGVIGLWAASSGYAYSRMYLIVFGLVYGLVTVLGFMTGSILGLFTVNMPDNYLHLAISAACLVVGLGSKK